MGFCSFSGTGLMSGPPNASFPHPIPQLTNYPPPPISPMSQFNSPPPLHLNLLQQTFPPPLQRAESSNSTKEASHLRVPTKSRHDQVIDHLVFNRNLTDQFKSFVALIFNGNGIKPIPFPYFIAKI